MLPSVPPTGREVGGGKNGPPAGNWERLRATADETPRISPEFLDEERGRKTRREYRQEYFGEFEEAEAVSRSLRYE